jgi:hypothetical protein
MCDNPFHDYMEAEVKKLQVENERLRKDRMEIWDRAAQATRVEATLRDLLRLMDTAKEAAGGS